MQQVGIKIARDDMGYLSWTLPEKLAGDLENLEINSAKRVALNEAIESCLKDMCRSLVAACSDVIERDTGTALVMLRRQTGELYTQVLLAVCPVRNEREEV